MSSASPVSELCEQVGIQTPGGWSEYLDLAREWGARTDLTSARSDRELAEILFLDAAFVVKAAWCAVGARMVDVGAGVGAPTIPLLSSHPALHATLVEPRRIRTAFLRTAIGSLGLVERARVLETKVDPEDPAVDGMPFDVALSRATFAPEQWLAIGSKLAEEVWVLTAGGEPEALGGQQLVRRIDYRVPSSGAPRAILAYRR